MDRIRNSKGKFIKENEGDITKFNPTFQELLNYLWIKTFSNYNLSLPIY